MKRLASIVYTGKGRKNRGELPEGWSSREADMVDCRGRKTGSVQRKAQFVLMLFVLFPPANSAVDGPK